MLYVKEAKRIGYREMRLDTLPSMARAIALYRKLGFETIEPYYETPHDRHDFHAPLSDRTLDTV
jgi:ribosomal protein S18 acetylase RimI-like enzyme